MKRSVQAAKKLTVLALAFAAFGMSQAEAQATFPGARWIAASSSNYSRRSSRRITKVVIHTIEGSEDGGISWFRNRRAKVSAHYVVSYAGRVTQMLRDSDIGWHARGVNSTSIGIENEGYAGRNGWTSAQLSKLASLVRHLCNRHGIAKTRSNIIGHYQVDPARRTDPGRYFPWTRFISMVNGGSAAPAPAPQNPAPRTPTPSTPSASPTSSAGFAVQITASALKVRAGVWGTVLGQVFRNQMFVVTGQSQGWYQINWNGRRGWISGKYARRGRGGMAARATTTVNVRTGPSTRYRRIGAAWDGQRYVVLGRSGAWLRIQYDSRVGYLHGNYARSESLR